MKIGQYKIAEINPTGETLLKSNLATLTISYYDNEYQVEKHCQFHAMTLSEEDMKIALKVIKELKHKHIMDLYKNTNYPITVIADKIGLNYTSVYNYIRLKESKV